MPNLCLILSFLNTKKTFPINKLIILFSGSQDLLEEEAEEEAEEPEFEGEH
jgi:hypothetical protein